MYWLSRISIVVKKKTVTNIPSSDLWVFSISIVLYTYWNQNFSILDFSFQTVSEKMFLQIRRHDFKPGYLCSTSSPSATATTQLDFCLETMTLVHLLPFVHAAEMYCYINIRVYSSVARGRWRLTLSI